LGFVVFVKNQVLCILVVFVDAWFVINVLTMNIEYVPPVNQVNNKKRKPYIHALEFRIYISGRKLDYG